MIAVNDSTIVRAMAKKRFQGVRLKRPLLGYEDVYFSQHAMLRMSQRGITREDVYHAIEQPDATGLPTAPGRHRVRWNKTPEKGVDVVYALQDDCVSIVTTFISDLTLPANTAPTIVRVKRTLPPNPKRKTAKRKKR